MHQNAPPTDWLNAVAIAAAADLGGPLKNPSVIVLHYTAGADSVPWLTADDDVPVSSHFLVDRAGDVTQMVPINRVAFHAGRSAWRDLEDLNEHSIGIELENWGLLHQRQDGQLVTWTDRPILNADAQYATHKANVAGWWQMFPDAQVKACVQLCTTLQVLLPSLTDIVGHDDIALNRKLDPGPLLDLDHIRSISCPRSVPPTHPSRFRSLFKPTDDNGTT